MMMTAVIFDIDGTLCDSLQLGLDASNRVLTRAGYREITTEEYCEGSKSTTPDRLAYHCGLSPEDSDGGDKFRSIGLRLGAEFDKDYIELVSKDSVPVFQGIPELVRELSQRVLVGALTNACAQYAERILEVHELRPHFKIVHGADTVPKAKPNPDGLLLCLAQLGNLSPSACIFVGDSPSDAEAASRAGMRSIGVSWGSHARHRLEMCFDIVVDSVDALHQLLLDSTSSQPTSFDCAHVTIE